MASGAADVLARARVVATLAEALDGVTYACATAMTPRDFGPPTLAPRELLRDAGARRRTGVAFVFGAERFGLANDDVYRCHACLASRPHPDYGSLNLAQAVQLIAYDWRQALGGFAVRAAHRRRGGAPTRAAVQGAARALAARRWSQIGFLDPAAPKKLMPRLNQLLNRAELTRRGGAHPARHRPRESRSAKARATPDIRDPARRARLHRRATLTRATPLTAMFEPPARRHRLHPRARPGRALDAGRC